ncbi:MAG: hypothetical protein RMI01_10640, partial [Thermodesulfovibrio sp.]|nr:hypothetical protein [Thermodesulfovibrio sp.]
SVSKQSVSSLRMQANQMYEMTGNILFKQIGQAIEGQSLNMDMLKQAFQVANAQNNEQAKTLIENILNAG